MYSHWTKVKTISVDTIPVCALLGGFMTGWMGDHYFYAAVIVGWVTGWPILLLCYSDSWVDG